MPVTAKPFSKNLKLEKLIFKPRPNITSDQDINRSLDNLLDKSLVSANLLGGTRVNWGMSFTLIDSIVSGGSVTMSLYGTSTKPTNAGNPSYFDMQGIRFTAPAFDASITPIILTCLEANWKSAAFVGLVAKKVSKTFATDSVLCGVNSSEYPTVLPGPDAEIWQEERLVFSLLKDFSDVSLASGETFVGAVAAITSVERTTLNISQEPTVSAAWKILYLNTDNAKEVLDSLNPITGAPEIPRYKDMAKKAGLWDTFIYFFEFCMENFSKINVAGAFKNASNKFIKLQKFNLGGTVPSANLLNLTDAGNYFLVSGATTIELIRSLDSGQGTVVTLEMLGPVYFSNNTTGTSAGYKKVVFETPGGVFNDYKSSSFIAEKRSRLVLIEKTDAWYVIGYYAPDSFRSHYVGKGYFASLRYDGSSSSATPAFTSKFAKFVFNAVDIETYHNFAVSPRLDTGAHKFTTPRAGYYTFEVSASIGLPATTGNAFCHFVVRNITASPDEVFSLASVWKTTAAIEACFQGSRTVFLNANVEVDFGVFGEMADAVTMVLADNTYSGFNVKTNFIEIKFDGKHPTAD
jgi:hypothetical protein